MTMRSALCGTSALLARGSTFLAGGGGMPKATSVTALVSLHLVQPWVSAPILVRLADTLIGAAIAHLFNYLWPRWESMV